jgi:hypothetical protein
VNHVSADALRAGGGAGGGGGMRAPTKGGVSAITGGGGVSVVVLYFPDWGLRRCLLDSFRRPCFRENYDDTAYGPVHVAGAVLQLSGSYWLLQPSPVNMTWPAPSCFCMLTFGSVVLLLLCAVMLVRGKRQIYISPDNREVGGKGGLKLGRILGVVGGP